jgi:hypothetical protein
MSQTTWVIRAVYMKSSIRPSRILIACGFLVLCLACSGSNNQRTLLGYVPSSSYAVLAVNWKTVSKDPDLKRICKGAEIEKLFTQLGVAAESVTEFAVYGDPGAPAESGKGLIVKGSFDTAELVKQLLKAGWAEQELDGRRIYVNSKDAAWLTPFDEHLFVLGTESAVKDAMGARTSPENRFTFHPAYKVMSAHFEGEHYPILMMVALPQASQDVANAAVKLTSAVMNLAGVGPLGDLLDKIGYAQGLACAISHKDESFPVAVSAVMKDEDSAKFVSGALGLLKNLGGIVSKNYSTQTDPDTARAIQSMSVERKREVVSIRMTMSRRDLIGGANP